jgi:hypothetical protein
VSKVAYTIRIDESIYEKAKMVAEKEHRSVNNLVEYLLLLRIQEHGLFEGPQSEPDQETQG